MLLFLHQRGIIYVQESACELSSHTDDLVAASYAPQNAEALSDAAVRLASAGLCISPPPASPIH